MLGMTVEEVRALPWWQADLYDEGLADELSGGRGPVDDDGVPVNDMDQEPEPEQVTFGP